MDKWVPVGRAIDSLDIFVGKGGKYIEVPDICLNLPGNLCLCELEVVEVPVPDWSWVPEWAMWWVHSVNGFYWHEFEPYLSIWGDWERNRDQSSGRRKYSRVDYVCSNLPIGIDYRTLKAQRPVAREA